MRVAKLTTVLLALAVAVGAPAAPGFAVTSSGGDSPPTTTQSARVTAQCVVSPAVLNPRFQDYTVVVTVPTRVAPGTNAEIHVSVDYPVQPTADAGAISVVAHQGDAATQQFIVSPPGSPTIDGTASFPVTGAAGSTIEWEIVLWGSEGTFGATQVSDICSPTTPIDVPSTRIGARHGVLDALLAWFRAHFCGGRRMPPIFARLCRI
jgi:hypothetical protein